MAYLDRPTKRQEVLAQEFIKSRDKEAAWRIAYDQPDAPPGTAANRAREAFRSPVLKDRIEELLYAEETDAAPFARQTAIDRLLGMLQADPNELIAVRVGACRYCHGNDHEYQWDRREYRLAMKEVDVFNKDKPPKMAAKDYPDCAGGFGWDRAADPHPNCPDCSGEGVSRIVMKNTEELSPGARLIYGGVKQTAQGLQIIMADKVKVLDMLLRVIGGYDDKIRVDINAKAVVGVLSASYPTVEAANAAYKELIAAELTAPS